MLTLCVCDCGPCCSLGSGKLNGVHYVHVCVCVCVRACVCYCPFAFTLPVLNLR